MEQLKEEYQLPVYLFHEGKNYEAYRFFGVHKIKKGTYAFRVWAPHAVGVAVAGDFNDCTGDLGSGGGRCFQV